MTQRKKLIEVALPLEAINAASAREKSIRHGHPSTLHLWWARRPLAAARAVIFTSLVDDPDDANAPPAFVQACRNLPKGKNATANDTPRQRLFDFIERLVTWEATTDEAILTTARELIKLSTDGSPPPLLDPFAGGGSIPLEAQRLGLEAHASDLNPVAVMINKALIEIPPKFANQPPVNPRDRAKVGGTSAWKGASGLAADVRYYGEWMRDRAWERIGHLYPKCNGETVIAWLWARTVKCPNPACGAQMPLINTFWLSKKKGQRAWLEPTIKGASKTITFKVRQGDGSPSDATKVGRGASFKCLVCNQIADSNKVRLQFQKKNSDHQLTAIVTKSQSGRSYYPSTLDHIEIANNAQPSWQPEAEMNQESSDLVSGRGYGFSYWYELYTYRQLVTLTTLSDLLDEVLEQVKFDVINLSPFEGITQHIEQEINATSYAEAIKTYLSLALDKVAENNTQFCTWSPLSSKLHVVGTFGRQALPMVWDYAEANPFADSSGNIERMANLIAKVIERQGATTKMPGKASQVNITEKINSSEKFLISTDPPYYDNISYADLSDFAYIWLRHNLKENYPNLFATLLVPKTQELVAATYRFKNVDEARAFFENGLRLSFERMREVSHMNFPVTIYYAFRQSEIVISKENNDSEVVSSTGWETMLEGLLKAGFSISGTWPVRTERSGGFRNFNQNALASSIVLVCRPRPENAPLTSRREFVNTLRRELPAALREMQSGNIAPVDLAQASIGPGMAVYSRYSQVLEPDGRRLTVRAALQLINQVLDEYLAEAEGDLDSDSRFAVSWFEQYGFNSGEFGVADVLARAKNTSVDGLVNAGVIEAGAGKVRLLTWEELDPGWDPGSDSRPTVWEATHHLIERLHVHGEEGAALLLAKMSPDLTADARQLAYRLYAICERKGWSENGRDYNALVISWSTSQERAAEVKQSYQQRHLFE